MTDSNQCGHPVEYIVHHPYFAGGDFYCVCATHLEWAKRRLGTGDILVSPGKTETGYPIILSGCVWWDHTKHPTPKNRLPLAGSGTVA